MASVYRKTGKGTAEIATRANRLAPRLRTVLIMVDGRRSDDDLRKLIAADAEEVLATLLAEGYIEVIGVLAERSAPAPATASATTPAPAPAAKTRDWEERRREAVRFLSDKLGPQAELLVLKIEKARDSAELKPYLAGAEQLLRTAQGAETARDFAARFIEASGA